MLHNKNKKKTSAKNNKGFTLIELAIAIFILSIAVIGVYNSFSTVVILTSGASSHFTAAYLAQEGIEIVRNMRDNNWIQGLDWENGLSDTTTDCSTGCEADYRTGTSLDAGAGLTPFGSSGRFLNIKEGSFYTYDATGNVFPTKFKRKITITDVSPALCLTPCDLKVSVLVTWREKEESFSISADEYLYDWY